MTYRDHSQVQIDVDNLAALDKNDMPLHWAALLALQVAAGVAVGISLSVWLAPILIHFVRGG